MSHRITILQTRYCTLLLLLSLYYSASAQDDTIKKIDSFIAVGFGPAFPLGGFASTTGTGLGSYATHGRCAYLSGGFIIKRLKFGFAIKEGWYYCGYNPGKYLKTLGAKYDTLPGMTYTQYGGGNEYNGGYGMLGFIADIKIHKLAIGFRLLGGRVTATFPEVSYTVSSTGNSASLYDFASSAVSVLGTEAGVNARYSFAKHFSAVIDVSFLYSSFDYSTTFQITNPSGTGDSGSIAYNCVLFVINTSAGIAYQF